MIRILIADDHAIVRKGLKQILLEHYTSATIGEAIDAESLINEVHTAEWDVVICDMSMPGRSGLDALHDQARGIEQGTVPVEDDEVEAACSHVGVRSAASVAQSDSQSPGRGLCSVTRCPSTGWSKASSRA